MVFPSMAEALHLIVEYKSLTQDYRLKSTTIAFHSTPRQWLPNSQDIKNFLCKSESSQHLFRFFTLQLSRKVSNLGIFICITSYTKPVKWYFNYSVPKSTCVQEFCSLSFLLDFYWGLLAPNNDTETYH